MVEMRAGLSPALIAIVIGCQPAAQAPAQRGWRAAFSVLVTRLVAVREQEAEPEPEGVLTHRDAPLHERSSPLAKRASVEDAVLLPYRAVLESHFDGATRKDLRVQSVDLAGHRRSLLVQSEMAPQRPLIVTTEPNGVLSWTKERPLAGMVDDIEHLSLLPGPEGGIALFLLAASEQSVGARMWDGDGGIISDFHLLRMPGVLDVAAMYASGTGWIITASNKEGVRMQRLDEEGRIENERAGLEIGSTLISSEAIALARDGDASFMLLQLGPPVNGARARRHLYASRLDMHGKPLWPRALEVGTVSIATPPPSLETSVNDGLVRLTVRADGETLLRVWVSSNGTIERQALR